MLDYESGSYWWQVAGAAIVGARTGTRLQVLPSMTTTWAEWQALHPNTLVLSRDTGHQRDYSRDPFRGIETYFNRGQFVFPVSAAALDDRLRPGDKVLTVNVGDSVKAYPVKQTGLTIVADTIDGEDVVVFLYPESASGAAFRPLISGEMMAFTVQDGTIIDAETGSTWDRTGHAVAGARIGQQLLQLPTKTAFWFAIVAAEPDVVVWGG